MQILRYLPAVALLAATSSAIANGLTAAQEAPGTFRPGSAATSPWHTVLFTGARHATVAEYDAAGKRVVRERGWLPGIGAALSYQAGDWTGFGAISTYRGQLDYDGRLQSGQPYRSETDTDLDRVQVGMKYRLSDRYGALAGFEYDRWKRNIEGGPDVAGLQERTSSRRLVLGLDRQFAIGAAGSLEAGLSLIRAEPERLKVGFSGLADPASFKTRSATGYRINLVYRPKSTANLEIGMELDRMKIGRSELHPVTRNGELVAFVAQPEHARKHATLTVGYRF